MRWSLAVIIPAAVCGSAQAAPFAVRTAGADTVIAVDLGSTVRYGGPLRIALAYQFFHGGGPLAGRRLQVMATRTMVNCKTRLEWDLGSVGYLASGVQVASHGPDRVWTPMLRGSNSDYILDAICHRPDAAWRIVRAPTVFDAYRAVWR